MEDKSKMEDVFLEIYGLLCFLAVRLDDEAILARLIELEERVAWLTLWESLEE